LGNRSHRRLPTYRSPPTPREPHPRQRSSGDPAGPADYPL